MKFQKIGYAALLLLLSTTVMAGELAGGNSGESTDLKMEQAKPVAWHSLLGCGLSNSTPNDLVAYSQADEGSKPVSAIRAYTRFPPAGTKELKGHIDMRKAVINGQRGTRSEL